MVWCSYLETQSPKLGCDVLAAAALQPGDKRSDQNKKKQKSVVFQQKDPMDIPRLPCETAPPKDPGA